MATKLALLTLGLALQSSVVIASAKLEARGPVSVTVNGGTFLGEEKSGISKFLGIPYAQPPVGDLRFRLPQPITYNGTYSATNYGPSCHQRPADSPEGLFDEALEFFLSLFKGPTNVESEDCLTLNIIKPANTNANSKLPVAVWIYGGSFDSGGAFDHDSGGTTIVKRSISQKQPVIFVSVNYRVNGFGFLASREIREDGVGNLGLRDQREALHWVRKHITAFGGDPDKVTIWGQSAGGISAALQMVANEGNHENLFRGAFLQSGAPTPSGPLEKGQIYYDAVVKTTGCEGSSDTLQCLRTLPYETLKTAIDQATIAFPALGLAWLPRVDDTFITAEPMLLIAQGKIANVPFVCGNVDDEGTFFAAGQLDIKTEEQFRNWLQYGFLPGITDAQVDKIATLYPSDPREGSPYNTGILNAITPQFKRLASIQGDGMFQAPRRWLLQHTSHRQNTWSYVSTRFKFIPVLGSMHTTDLSNAFNGGEMGDHVISFVNKLDPNTKGLFSVNWPKYTMDTKKMMVYKTGLLIRLDTTEDTFREAAMNALIEVALSQSA